jgi:hypothetical protein
LHAAARCAGPIDRHERRQDRGAMAGCIAAQAEKIAPPKQDNLSRRTATFYASQAWNSRQEAGPPTPYPA